MAYTLTQKQKNILDRLLWLIGIVGGYLTSLAASQASPERQLIFSVVGLGLADVASDGIGWVETGQLPSTPVVAGQLASLYSQTKPLIQTEIAKLPPSDQQAASLALSLLEDKLKALSGP